MNLENLNKTTYKSQEIVEYYLKKEGLFGSEQVLLDKIKDKLGNMKMLDIGVGGGRTTAYFAKLCKEYVGIDYSTEMINSCKKRFPEFTFYTCNARDMGLFEDDSFDFVLFSLNGLDYITHKDRLRALNEIKRVAKENALFVFSAHNLQCVPVLFKFKKFKNPVNIIKEILRQIKLKLKNDRSYNLKELNYALINDGAHNFKLKTYYIKPKYQIEQLEKMGFKNINAHFRDTGKIIDFKDLESIKDIWIGYSCVTSKSTSFVGELK